MEQIDTLWWRRLIAPGRSALVYGAHRRLAHDPATLAELL